MSEEAPGVLPRFWPRRSKAPPEPPITDAEVDPSRAPWVNDLIHGLIVAGLAAWALFWDLFYFLGPEDRQHFWEALLIAVALGAILLGLSFGIGRIMKMSAHSRKGYTFTRRAKVVIGVFFGLIVGVVVIRGLTKYGDALTQDGIGLAALCGLVGGLLVLALLSSYRNIPPQPYRKPPTAS